METNKEPYLLSLLSLVFLVAGFALPGWPFLIALALAPLFRLHTLFRSAEAPFLKYFTFILIPLTAGYLMISLFFVPAVTLLQGLFYGILMSIAFFIFWLTDQYAKNRLGFFTIMIFWLAMEYAAIQLLPGYTHLLLGTVLLSFPGMIAWENGTGIMGVTAWIFLANILFYYVFFRYPGILSGKFRPLTLLYSLILLSVPGIISWQFYSPDALITPAEATLALVRPQELSGEHEAYAQTGEVFGRTSAWVGVLLVLYSLVKRKVNR